MHAPSGIKMASTSEAGASGVKEKRSRKRKRGGILGFTSSWSSTPAIISQAPRGINAAEFAEARALEINNMVEAIKEADSLSGKRLFQTLPKHMRRRAMSHNIKRIPSRLRQRASLEMNKQDHKTSEVPKKKSRRYRRKPKNLMEEYTRRQREHVWLETHIWHAKRMKMIDAWGYRLADHPNDKGFRAAYRAVKNNCMLQDISYYGCIEVCGAKSQIIQAMGHLTSQEAGLTFAAKYYLNGTRQGNAVLYKFDQYPQGAIGPVSFLWRQRRSSDTEANVDTSQLLEIEEGTVNENTFDSHCDISQLWIWSHPASFNSVFDSITEACSYVGSCVVETDSKFPGAAKINSNVNSDQPNGDNIQLLNGIEHCEIKVVSRRFDLLRFRLTGPQSHVVLASAITPAFDSSKKTPPERIVNQDSGALCKDKNLNISLKWWHRLQGSSTKLSSQNELWSRLKQASSPSVLPPGCVFGLTVRDPRLNLPVKKISIRSVAEGIHSDNSDSGGETDFTFDEAVNTLEKRKPAPFEQILSHWPNDVANSPIWDASVRLEVKESKIPEQELNRKRSELLVPGSRLKLSENEISHIPLLLIQQPGCSDNDRGTLINNGYGSGWDIILPFGWAMAFWMALVYRGARTGGLQESQTSALELGVPFFPNDFPDTPAGEAYNIKLKDDGEAQYKRYPPSKRPNYERLGVKSPFSPPWRELVKDWPSLNKPSTIAGELSNKTSDSTRIDQSVSDSAQMDVSVVQTLQLSSSLTDDSIVNPETDVTSSDSSQGVSSDQSLVKLSLSKDAQTRITCDSTKTTGIENNCNQTTGKNVQPFYVLRSRTKLSALRCYTLRHKQKRMADSKQSKATNNLSKPLDESRLSSIVVGDFNSLVCVQLQMVQRSVPVPNSSVVIPSSEDISKHQKCKNFAGPLEPLHKGPKGHLTEKSLRNSCTRETLGFVSSGHYSLSRGCGFGVAFCVLPGLVKLLSTCSTKECIVLVRGPSMQQYRFAYLTIL